MFPRRDRRALSGNAITDALALGERARIECNSLGFIEMSKQTGQSTLSGSARVHLSEHESIELSSFWRNLDK